MRRLRLFSVVLTPLVALLMFAPSALATSHAGEGLYGPTDDKTITLVMFAVMVFFVLVIVVFSLLQGWLDHRKHARIDAARNRKSSVDWKGGW
jgi:peptidoglycan biosynthesis protein MviN/MurJ (putative lipid II flippase)